MKAAALAYDAAALACAAGTDVDTNFPPTPGQVRPMIRTSPLQIGRPLCFVVVLL